MKIKIILSLLFSYSLFVAGSLNDHVDDLTCSSGSDRSLFLGAGFTIEDILEKVLCTPSKEYDELCAELNSAWIDFKSIPEQVKLYNQYKRIYCKLELELEQNGKCKETVDAAHSVISKLSEPSKADCEICDRFFQLEEKLKKWIKNTGILDVRASSKDIEKSIKFTTYYKEIDKYMTNLEAKKEILQNFNIRIIQEKEEIKEMNRNSNIRKMQEIKEIKNEKSKRKTKEKGRNYNRRGMQEIKEIE